MKHYYTLIESPIGLITLISDGKSLTGLYMEKHLHATEVEPGWIESASTTPLPQAKAQLTEYFAGERTEFDLPLNLEGTPFQKQVWKELLEIPFGETISYGELAKRVGNPNASRAVGLANGRNPVSIVVPCHRVIGASGSLTGYGGGLPRKQALLEMEKSKTGQGSLFG